MSEETPKRPPVFFEPALREDRQDLAAFEDRVAEPEISYEALLKDLKAHGKL